MGSERSATQLLKKLDSTIPNRNSSVRPDKMKLLLSFTAFLLAIPAALAALDARGGGDCNDANGAGMS
jgi:hypothetical protein